MKRVCVYCGSSFGKNPIYLEKAQVLAQALVKNDISLVYGGSKMGLMGSIANEVLAHGGQVIGVIPEVLKDKEIAHTGLTEIHYADSIHSRKALMAELSDGFIALPGGFGTFEEFCEVLMWSQIGLHDKPTALFNVNGFFSSLISMFEHAVREGFARDQHLEHVLISSDPHEILALMKSYKPFVVSKEWIEAVPSTK